MTATTGSVRDELRRRAAVVAHFEPGWLGLKEAGGDEVDALLLDDCGRARGADGVRHWTLTDAVRRAVVARTAPAILRAAWREVHVRPNGAQQWAIDRLLIDGELPELDDLDAEHVRALDAVSRWTGGAHSRELQRRLRLRDLLARLRAVATNRFVGREELLVRLAERPPGGPALLVHGFGGVGKSAVLARHLVRARDERAAQIAYLNFDHTALDPLQTTSLIVALAEQLSWQLDDAMSKIVEDVAERARDRLRTGGRELEVSSRDAQVDAQWNVDLLANLWSATMSRPTVIAIDTLEEVQRRPELAQQRLVHLLDDIARVYPTAQVVMAGRAAFPGTPWTHEELPGLERAEAIELLTHLAGKRPGLGRIVDVVGTSPLVLRLAASLLAKSAEDDPLRDLALHRIGIEGTLYRRLLEHVDDEDVRRLAHPGLTLRRVTPALIRHVIARPCGVRVRDDERARELFGALAREAMLVEPVPGDPWAVTHRADVRRMMLAPLADDDPDVVRRIHRAAIRFHSDDDDIVGRAEAMYHRLMLGQRNRTLDKHWSSDIGPRLAESIDELPPASKAYLAVHADLAISPDDVRAAELVTRRLHVQRVVQGLLAGARSSEALDVLDAYEKDTGDVSPAAVGLRVQSLELDGQLADALEQAEAEQAAASRRGDAEAFFAFTFHVARLGERVGDASGALESLAPALEFARGLQPTEHHRVTRLRLVVAALAVARRAGKPLDDGRVDEAIALYDGLPTRAVRTQPGLLRELAAEVGSRSPAILKAALRTVGIESPAGDAIERLERGGRGIKAAEAIEALPEEEAAATSDRYGDEYAREVDAAVDYAPGLADDATLAQEHDAAGDQALSRGDAITAEKHYREALVIREHRAARDPGDRSTVHELIVSYDRLGDLMLRLDDVPQAERFLSSMLEVAERLAAAEPDDVDVQHALLVSQFKLGEIAARTGDARAEPFLRTALALAERIAATHADDERAQRELLATQRRLATRLFETDDHVEAEHLFHDAANTAERLAAADPADPEGQRGLARAYDEIGDVLLARDTAADAEHWFRRALELREGRTAADPSDAEALSDLATSYDRLGDVLLRTGDGAAAEGQFLSGLAIREHLAAADPADMNAQRARFVSYNRLGDLKLQVADKPAAERYFRDSLAGMLRVADADPSDIGAQRALAFAYGRLGGLTLELGDVAEAERLLRNGLAIGERLAASDPGNAELQRDASVAYERLGDALLQGDDLAEAGRYYGASLAIDRELAAGASSDAGLQRHLAVSLAKQGYLLARTGDRAAAEEHLQEALAAAELAGAELAPIIGELLTELETADGLS